MTPKIEIFARKSLNNGVQGRELMHAVLTSGPD